MNNESLNENYQEKNDYSERNRHKAFHSKKKSIGWCICDRAKAGCFGKCKVCGRKSKDHLKKRLKGF